MTAAQRRASARAPTLLLLHGLGANAAVWARLTPLIDQAGYRWIAPDLPGHGKAAWRDTYDHATHAHAVAQACETASELIVVGHSMGAIVGMALAAVDHGLKLRGIVAFSVKLGFDPAFVERMHRVGAQAPRWYDAPQDAAARHLAFAGLDRLEPVDGAMAIAGIVAASADNTKERQSPRYRIATDPRVYLGVGGDIGALVSKRKVPVRVLGGTADSMISLEDMRRIDPDAFMLEGLGHNPQVEAPEQLWAAIAPIIGAWGGMDR